jgi:hypothetical protein
MSLADGLFPGLRDGMREQNRKKGKGAPEQGLHDFRPDLFVTSMPRRYDLRVTADSVLLAATRTCSGWDASVKLSSSVIA